MADSGPLPAAGGTLQRGELTLTVTQVLAPGLYRATTAAGERVLVHDTELTFAAAHPLLPAFLYTGPEGYVVPWLEGSALTPPLDLPTAVSRLITLAQLVRFFEAQGYAVVALDPTHLMETADGLRLRLPPDVEASGRSTGREGVYLLGALLYWLLTGDPLPAGDVPPAAIALPGVPQLLGQSLAPVHARLSTQEFLNALRALAVPPAPVLRVGSATTVGLSAERPTNEDSHGYTLQTIQSYASQAHLLRAVLADGMGGMAAGEVASHAAVTAFLAPLPPALETPEQLADWAIELAWHANQAVLAALRGANGGCTLTAVVCQGARCALAHVGDSRAYRWAGGALEQLSQDHSLVAAMVASGFMTAVEAAVSPDRSKLLRSLGNVRQPQPGYIADLSAAGHGRTLELGPGEYLVLVSDGIWGEVGEAAMRAALEATAGDPQGMADRLVQAAIDAGAPDNATALIIHRVA